MAYTCRPSGAFEIFVFAFYTPVRISVALGTLSCGIYYQDSLSPSLISQLIAHYGIFYRISIALTDRSVDLI